jgi:RimJ/RimL family protein N-acetyltransferase
MELLFGYDAAVADWVGARIPHVGAGGFGPCVAVGVVRGGDLVAGAVFHNEIKAYAIGELSFAAATPRWATRDMIRGILAIPFVQYRWRRLTAITPHDNERAIKLMAGLGFKREGVAREMFSSRPKVHGAIFSMMTREHAALMERLS